MTDSDLSKLYPPARFKIVNWEADGRIIVDLESGPLGAKRRSTVIVKTMSQELTKSRSKRLDEMSQESRNAISGFLDRAIGATPSSLSSASGSFTVGATVSLMFEVTCGENSMPKRGEIQLQDKAQEQADKELALNPIPSFHKNRTEKEVEAFKKRNSEFRLIDDTATICLLGKARFDPVSAMETGNRAFKAVYDDLEQQKINANLEFIRSLGLEGSEWDKAVGSGKQSLNDLPSGLRKNIESNFLANWKQNGFGSEAESQTWLSSASFTLRSTIFVKWCENSNINPNGSPQVPAYILHQIGSVGGYPGR
jgi:hypothetical protein